MDMIRAKQILETPKEVEVHHEGAPIWIQNVDEHAQTARIYPTADPENEKTVPVHELEEK
ncbi:H-type small acid-soluble spore protein [Desmospora profundinema]|uniref:Small acid-soluble spore protein H (Minor) n=1 Tax=Desmospora profundinema TaxID=1571184 RepID=A0ABU1IQP7_9BACL|nr:H-type small acid-soluble spore protein [Desmospora profundinema]MDR6226867.1 small acid-soluble spore protein H (minor) [Desmospora profundinema]